MSKKKNQTFKDWTYSEKINSRKSNRDITFSFLIPSNIRIESICADAWIYTDNPDGYKVMIKEIIKLDNDILMESPIAETTKGTAWASCIYEFDELCSSGTITIKTIGSLFKKGLNVSLKGFEVIDG